MYTLGETSKEYTIPLTVGLELEVLGAMAKLTQGMASMKDPGGMATLADVSTQTAPEMLGQDNHIGDVDVGWTPTMLASSREHGKCKAVGDCWRRVLALRTTATGWSLSAPRPTPEKLRGFNEGGRNVRTPPSGRKKGVCIRPRVFPLQELAGTGKREAEYKRLLLATR